MKTVSMILALLAAVLAVTHAHASAVEVKDITSEMNCEVRVFSLFLLMDGLSCGVYAEAVCAPPSAALLREPRMRAVCSWCGLRCWGRVRQPLQRVQAVRR
jgi:hypothetical protein